MTTEPKTIADLERELAEALQQRDVARKDHQFAIKDNLVTRRGWTAMEDELAEARRLVASVAEAHGPVEEPLDAIFKVAPWLRKEHEQRLASATRRARASAFAEAAEILRQRVLTRDNELVAAAIFDCYKAIDRLSTEQETGG